MAKSWDTKRPSWNWKISSMPNKMQQHLNYWRYQTLFSSSLPLTSSSILMLLIPFHIWNDLTIFHFSHLISLEWVTDWLLYFLQTISLWPKMSHFRAGNQCPYQRLRQLVDAQTDFMCKWGQFYIGHCIAIYTWLLCPCLGGV